MTLLQALLSVALLCGEPGIKEPVPLHKVIGLPESIEIIEFEGQRKPIVGDESPSAEVCKDFDLAPNDVEFFFRRAIVIDPQILEKVYKWFPCHIRGEALVGSNVFGWVITPGGKGFITKQGTEDEVIYAVCDKGCLEVFPFGGKERMDLDSY